MAEMDAVLAGDRPWAIRRGEAMTADEVRAWIAAHELTGRLQRLGEPDPGIVETAALLAAFDHWAAKRWLGYWGEANELVRKSWR